MPPIHRTYDKDFRQEAVNLLLSSGRPLKRVAAELGVTPNSLRTWRDRALGKGRLAQAASAEPKGRSQAPLADPAGEIRRLTDQFEDLHFLDLPGRLARHLLRQVVPDGQPVPVGEVRQPWPYTQGELAGMIGGSRQSVNRLLADFVAKGLLRFEGDYLVIPDSRRLAEAVNR
jgi:transposase-like protein